MEAGLRGRKGTSPEGRKAVDGIDYFDHVVSDSMTTQTGAWSLRPPSAFLARIHPLILLR